MLGQLPRLCQAARWSGQSPRSQLSRTMCVQALSGEVGVHALLLRDMTAFTPACRWLSGRVGHSRYGFSRCAPCGFPNYLKHRSCCCFHERTGRAEQRKGNVSSPFLVIVWHLSRNCPKHPGHKPGDTGGGCQSFKHKSLRKTKIKPCP